MVVGFFDFSRTERSTHFLVSFRVIVGYFIVTAEVRFLIFVKFCSEMRFGIAAQIPLYNHNHYHHHLHLAPIPFFLGPLNSGFVCLPSFHVQSLVAFRTGLLLGCLHSSSSLFVASLPPPLCSPRSLIYTLNS